MSYTNLCRITIQLELLEFTRLRCGKVAMRVRPDDLLCRTCAKYGSLHGHYRTASVAYLLGRVNTHTYVRTIYEHGYFLSI